MATGDGEHIMRSCLAFLVVERMRQGASPQVLSLSRGARARALSLSRFHPLSLSLSTHTHTHTHTCLARCMQSGSLAFDCVQPSRQRVRRPYRASDKTAKSHPPAPPGLSMNKCTRSSQWGFWRFLFRAKWACRRRLALITRIAAEKPFRAPCGARTTSQKTRFRGCTELKRLARVVARV